MDVMLDRCAGLDIHKKTVTACVRMPDGNGGRAEHVRGFSTFLDGLVELRAWLLQQRVSHVAMEATSNYWLPVWRVLEEPLDPDDADPAAPFELLLCNARHIKHVPGRKTDVADAAWLAQLLECGLLRSSFVPPRDIRGLRAVTRYRKRLIQTRTSETQRVEKVLEDCVVKIGAVASRTLTKSGRAMIEAFDRRRARPRGARRPGQGATAPQDPPAHPGARRPLRRRPRRPAAPTPGPHRLARRRHLPP